MNTQEKPKIIRDVEAVFGPDFELFEAPKREGDNLVGLMACKKGKPKYALDEQGRLIGLNFYMTGLNATIWEKITGLIRSELANIRGLNVSFNQLTSFVLPSGMLQLEWLDVSDNDLKEFKLPLDILGLKRIHLERNPALASPPPEVVKQGSEGVLAWYASFKKDSPEKQDTYIKEIKILLVGEGLAGKTSLLKQIKGEPFDQHESQTHGVTVESIPLSTLDMFKKYEALKDVKAHFWDFGGQEIMHASHQFFLTHRSVYIFVLDSRTDNKKDYWLKHIQKFGGGSPAIVAINKMDENKNYSLEEKTLNERYPFIENRFHKISCKKGDGLEAFAKTVAALIPETPLFKTRISETWLRIKNQLASETSTKKYIDQDRFLNICIENGEENPEGQKTLLNYLNALGVVLHFPKLNLQGFYVLDPHWVTIGVYKIINSPSIENGMLIAEKLDYILNREENKLADYGPYKEKIIHYNWSERIYLVEIMKQFELLYEFKEDHYLLPGLLPKELNRPLPFEESDAINFIMEYDFLPNNVMPGLIIDMKADVVDVTYMWRNGALFSSGKLDCKALVRADMDKKRIYIAVNGEEHKKREYFMTIYYRLCTINSTFSELIIKEYMPVSGHPEIEYEYSGLLKREKAGEDRLYIPELDTALSVSKDFLNKISTKEEREQMRSGPGTHVHVHFDGKKEIMEHLHDIKGIAKDTHKNTRQLLLNNAQKTAYLEQLLIIAGDHKSDLNLAIQKIQALPTQSGDIQRINDLLEERLNYYFAQMPSSSQIVQKWKEAQAKMPDNIEQTWKLMIRIPFLFGEFEKELSFDAKHFVKYLRSEIKAFAKGEKSFKQLFIETD